VALWSRVAGFDPGQLAVMLTERSAVRAPLMRATIHLVSSADWLDLRPVMQPVLERLFKSTEFARNAADVNHGELALAARRWLNEPTTRSALAERLRTVWPEADLMSLAYMATYLFPLVQATPRGVWMEDCPAAWVMGESWLGQPLGQGTSPASVLYRNLAGFGPASARDFALWSGLTNVRAIVESARGRLITYKDESGKELFDLPGNPIPHPDTPAPPRFLPEYDNVLLSHHDRSRMIPLGRAVPLPPGRGATRGTILIDGFLGATWAVEHGQAGATLTITPSEELTDQTAESIRREGRRLLAFLSGDAGHLQVRFAPAEH
jgi:hypothetical protein